MTRTRLTVLAAVLGVLLALGIGRQLGALPGGVEPLADAVLFVAIVVTLVYGDAVAAFAAGGTDQ
jgi:hypothetical protein